MAKVRKFHSVNEIKKPSVSRRYHDDDQCAAGRDIPEHERRDGDGGYRLCEHCQRLDGK